jgi:hypothetical protein
MAASDRDQDAQKPREQRGGTTPDEAEARETGEWAGKSGIDLGAGDNADAVTDGGPDVPADAEPDLKDVGAAAREAERD